MKKWILTILAVTLLTACSDKTNNINQENMTTLALTQEWDKTFPKSEKVDHKKVTFHNRYGIVLASDMTTWLDSSLMISWRLSSRRTFRIQKL